MAFTNKIFTYNPSMRAVKLVRFLFCVWLLALPFGANLFHFSLGFLTIYPNLLLTIGLFPFAVLTLKKFNLLEFLFICFLFFWTIFEMIFANNIGMSSEVLFDIRSLLIQFFFATIIIGVYKFIGKEAFLNILITGLRCFLFVLMLSGIIEFMTGIHFAGYKTRELLDLPVGNIFYAPMFIHENPNDYLTYLIFVFLLLNLFDLKLRANYILKVLISLIIFVFSIYADSNIAKLICEGIILVYTFEIIKTFFKKERFKAIILPYFAVAVFLLITILTNPLFFGPKYKDGPNYRLNGVSVIEENNKQLSVLTAKEALAKAEQKKVIRYLDSINTQNPDGSANLRKNLVLNGIDFIKSEPIFGIGPGGFARKLKQKEQKYYVHTHTSPHNFPIEIISQYGIFGWLYFAFLILVIAKLLQLWRILNSNQKVSIVLLCASIPLLWMMPSAFLYLNIHCLFLPLLLILLDMMKDKPHLDDIK
jgi:hypothetical protein